MRCFIACLMLVSAAPVVAEADDILNWQRARENYVALVDGRKQFYQLTPIEQLELRELHRRLGEEAIETRSKRERCEDEQIAQLRSKRMSYLDRRHIDMVCRDEPE
ncbi:hypothetical protein [Altererythrobacter aquiaggeris]|uniref:hypothetical protein n=1 Tax=Aestuarierythrobacter aquiaggeris TaxID=1898396 RepID=UPI0030159761